VQKLAQNNPKMANKDSLKKHNSLANLKSSSEQIKDFRPKVTKISFILTGENGKKVKNCGKSINTSSTSF
jgi:hypothetical protein